MTVTDNIIGNSSLTGLIVGVSIMSLLLIACIVAFSVVFVVVIFILRTYKQQQHQLQHMKFKLHQIPGMSEEADGFD